MTRLISPLAAFGIAVGIAIGWGAGATEPYRLQPGDVVDIAVIEDPSLNRQALVRPDGKISMPLAGALTAEGRTPEELQGAIRSALRRDFVTPPSVSVALISTVETQELLDMYVLGAVARPGRLDLEEPVDVLQALAIAGGVTPFAAKSRIQIRRVENGAPVVILFDYELLEDGATPWEPTMLRAGDVIVVPERGLFE